MLLALGVEQLDGGLGLGGEQAVDHLPSVVATVYWTKLPSTLRLGSRMWIKSSSRGMAAMPVRSGPTVPPSPPWRWHLAHCCCEDHLALDGVAASSDQGVSSSMTFWRSGSGRPPPWEQRLGTAAIGRVGMGGQGLLLVERELGEPELALLEGVEQGRVHSVRRQQGPDRRGPEAGVRAGRRRPGLADARGLAGGDGVDQAGGEVGRRARRDQISSNCPAVSSSSARNSIELPGRGDPARRRRSASSSADGGQERGGDLGVDAARSPWMPQRRGQAHELARAAEGSSSKLDDGLLVLGDRASRLRSLGQPLASPRTIGIVDRVLGPPSAGRRGPPIVSAGPPRA